MDWLENEDILLQLSVYEAHILLGYLEGSGYHLESDGSQLYIYDDAEQSHEKTDIDEVVDKVCETNYILIQDTFEKLNKAEFHEDTTELESSLLSLYSDETRLDKIFERIKYKKDYEKMSFTAVNGEMKSGIKVR